MKESKTNHHQATVLGDSKNPGRKPLVAPLIQSTTYVQESLPAEPGHTYSRCSNPTVEEVERVLGELENAPPAVCFSTGIAAETALIMTVLSAGDHVIAGAAIYGGTVRLLNDLFTRFGIEVTFVDASQPDLVADAVRPNTKMVFIETPANPTLELTDIRRMADIAHAANAVLAVDNTFLTAIHQKPLELGADISLYSTTKHIEGHSAALGGAIVSRDTEFLERLSWTRKTTGTIQTPFNAWLTRQGLKTLPLRISQHSQNALTVARHLQKHPSVARVNYPGLDSFPQHELAVDQHIAGHGGVLSFELVGGYVAAQEFLPNLELGRLCEHVGTVETLYTHPASMTHADVPHDQLEEAGITPGLIRMSVGIEEVDAIVADFDAAIAHVQNLSNGDIMGEKGELCPATN